MMRGAVVVEKSFEHRIDLVEEIAAEFIQDLIIELLRAQVAIGATNPAFSRLIGLTLPNFESIKKTGPDRKLQLKSLVAIAASARGAELDAARDLALRAAVATYDARALKAGIIDSNSYTILRRALEARYGGR